MARQINLIDVRQLQPHPQPDALTMVLAGIVVLLLGLIWSGVLYYQTHQAQTQETASAAQLAASKAALDAATRRYSPRQANPKLKQQVAEYRHSLKLRREALGALERVSDSQQQGVSPYLRALARRHIDGVWLTKFDVDAVNGNITIGGRSLDPVLVGNYLAQLQQESVFKGRGFAMLEISRPTSAANIAPPVVPGGKPQLPATPSWIEFSLRSTPQNGAGLEMPHG